MQFTTFVLTSILSIAVAQQIPAIPPNDNYIGSTQASRQIVTQAQSTQILAAAISKAENLSTPECIAIVDPAGILVGFQRMDNVFPATIDLAIKKARSVALYNGAFPSEGLYNASQPGGAVYGLEETNGGLVVWGGGLPIFLGKKFIGAVGVSGSLLSEVDIQVGTAGVEAVGSTSAS